MQVSLHKSPEFFSIHSIFLASYEQNKESMTGGTTTDELAPISRGSLEKSQFYLFSPVSYVFTDK